ncbi:MAG: hypothetical protein R3Y26_07855 [Rikenellaceae bacterium]
MKKTNSIFRTIIVVFIISVVGLGKANCQTSSNVDINALKSKLLNGLSGILSGETSIDDIVSTVNAVGLNSNNRSTDFESGVAIATIESDVLDEISGMVASTKYANHFWVHNDSGDAPNVYLVNLEGELVATVELDGTINRDWEAIAIYDGYIYVGEIGDNNAVYADKKVYRFAEPTIDISKLDTTVKVKQVETMVFNFADQQRDSESFMIDPLTGNLIFVSKREALVVVYETPFIETRGDDTVSVNQIATIPVFMATAGDISYDGRDILIKNYYSIFLWSRESDDEPLSEVFKRTAKTLPYTVEPQGESIAWSADNSAYYTVSEKLNDIKPVIYMYKRIMENND